MAYGVAGALFQRAMTGKAAVVENSLLATAAWVLSGDITLTQMPGYQTHPQARLRAPLMQAYTARDGKLVQFMSLHPGPVWAPLCRALGLEALIEDPRFATEDLRLENSDALIGLIQARFSNSDYAELKPILKSVDFPWEPVNTIEDMVQDPQVLANGMIHDMAVGDATIKVVAGPTAFDGETIVGAPRSAPAMGSDTDALLAEVGYGADAIAGLKARGAVR